MTFINHKEKNSFAAEIPQTRNRQKLTCPINEFWLTRGRLTVVVDSKQNQPKKQQRTNQTLSQKKKTAGPYRVNPWTTFFSVAVNCFSRLSVLEFIRNRPSCCFLFLLFNSKTNVRNIPQILLRKRRNRKKKIDFDPVSNAKCNFITHFTGFQSNQTWCKTRIETFFLFHFRLLKQKYQKDWLGNSLKCFVCTKPAKNWMVANKTYMCTVIIEIIQQNKNKTMFFITNLLWTFSDRENYNNVTLSSLWSIKTKKSFGCWN